MMYNDILVHDVIKIKYSNPLECKCGALAIVDVDCAQWTRPFPNFVF